ncbi:MAG: pyrimidine 5'-nucleotidase [Rhodospirillales bacterium]|nr:pyrimidine 5'-nucleotidase [Rhodospirillales bacterium]
MTTLSATTVSSRRRRITPLRDAAAWVFDLDNTLYPASIDLFSQIDERMRSYIATFLRLDPDEAYRLQKQYFHEFGTSLRGLMNRHAMDPKPFLEHVHDVDVSVLSPSPMLEAALTALPGRKIIFTNASVAHALRVIERLGVSHHFADIFDIVEAGYMPKPEPETYRSVVARFGLDPHSAVMVEDMARNLTPAAALGMTTVWVRTRPEQGAKDADPAAVDYIVDDLPTWLADVVACRV